MRFDSPIPLSALCAAALLTFAALPAPANAQQVYRIVGPDGRVTFSDRAPTPPPGAATAKGSAAATTAATTATGTTAATATRTAGDVAATAGASPPQQADPAAGLPYGLREVAQRFPVTLYTSKDCPPCNAARSLLSARGIPFAEKTVETSADIAALRKISGESSLPFATVGSQFLKGFSPSEWSGYLDAAAYPAQNQLPANYRPAAPAPLVAIQTAAAPAGAASAGSGSDASVASDSVSGSGSGSAQESTRSQRARPAPARPAVTTGSPNSAGIQF